MQNQDIIFYGLTLKDLFIGVGWFLTVLGWSISNRQANKRERRKEVRGEMEAINKLLLQLKSSCLNYYLELPNHPNQKSLAAEIRFNVKILLGKVQRLEEKHNGFEINNAAAELFESITGKDFQSGKRKTYAADSDKIQKIESDMLYMIGQLEEGFNRHFS